MSSRRLHTDDDVDDARPGKINYAIYCDETGVHGSRHYGFGTLWIPWEARGRLSALVGTLRAHYGFRDEIKWNKVNRHSLPFHRALVEEFFRRSWLMFHSLIVERADVDMKKHASKDEAERKHFAMLVHNKVREFGDQTKVYRLRVDPLHWSYEKSDEVALKIVNARLRKELDHPSIHDIIACDSRGTAGVQLADLLLGAVSDAWEGASSSAPKKALREHIAAHLGWSDLRSDTSPDEWKFNVWRYWDPTSGRPRPTTTRSVTLRFPMTRRSRRYARR